MSLRFLPAALGGVVLGLAIGQAPALAADAQQIADSIAALATAEGGQATYETATASGDDVTITGYTMTSEDGDALSIPSIVIVNAQPRAPGGFTADRVDFNNGDYQGPDASLTWETAAVTNAVVPSPDEINAKARLQPFGRMDIGGITVTAKDMPAPLGIGAVGVSMEADPEGNPRSFTMDVSDVQVTPDFYADEAQAKAVLDALGYSEGFVINIAVDGIYEHTTDTATLRSFTVESADVGKLAINGTFTEVPLSSFADEATAQDAAVKGKLDALTIRFDNGGIVERALDMQAQMMGTSREQYAAQMGGALPFMLNVIGNPPFQEKVAAAGQAFLKDPQSITITASPAEPVSFGQIMTAVTNGPQALPDLLSVDVTANN